MKKQYALLLALALPLCLPLPAAAQFEDIPAAMAGDLGGTDRGDYFWKREELDFGNDPYTAVCLNGRYVRSLRGFNQEIMADLYGCGHNRVSPREAWAELADSTARVAGETVYYFGGTPFRAVENHSCPEYRPEVLTLAGLWRQYAPARTDWRQSLFLFDYDLMADAPASFCFDRRYIRTDTLSLHWISFGPEEHRPAMPHLLFCLYTPKQAPERHRPLRLHDEGGETVFRYNPRSCREANNDSLEVYLGKDCIGSLMGIDITRIAKSPRSHVSLSTGRDGKTRLRISSPDYRPRLVGLEQMLDRYYPALGPMRRKQHYAFLINGIPVSAHARELRLDPDYVHTVRIHEVDARHVVVCLYTRTPEAVSSETGTPLPLLMQ